MSEPEGKTAKPQRRAKRSVSYPNEVLLGLFYVQRYRFLKIDQFARAAGMKPSAAAEALRSLKTAGWVDTFGGVPTEGRGRLPTVYYLKRKGWEGLRREMPEELVGPYREVHTEATWRSRMEHREKLIDCMIALEVGVRARPYLDLVRVMLEYKMTTTEEHGTQRETTDWFGNNERIIPDAAFILRDLRDKLPRLYLFEVDMGTETITSQIRKDASYTLEHRLRQYDRYLSSDAFLKKYSALGEFAGALVLFVTTTASRVEKLRVIPCMLPEQYKTIYRFNTIERVTENFFNVEWRVRSASDGSGYRIAREENEGPREARPVQGDTRDGHRQGQVRAHGPGRTDPRGVAKPR